MSKRDRHFEAFADHTLLKHAILQAYLQSWAFKILQWGQAGNTVCYVDGFAGAGRDGAGNPGSPLIACRIAQVVRGHLGSGPRPRTAQLRVLAVESDPATFAILDEQLAAFKRMDPAGVHGYVGSISDRMGDIAEEIGSQPTLFFLDPFGLKGLDATKYPAMLSGAHNEVFALFADIGAARLRGVVHADAGVERQLRAIREAPALFPQLDAQKESELVAKAGEKRKVVQQFGDAAKAAITSALGDSDWVQDLRDLAPTEAREELIVRFMAKLVRSGARYVQVLPMRGATGGHKYCLVHASKSLRGYTAMKEAVSESLNKTELAQDMRDRMREDLRLPVAGLLSTLQQRFRGQTVRWSGLKAKEVTVQRMLLQETDVFPLQFKEIKAALKGCGWLQRPNKIEVCVFPEAYVA